VVKKYRNDDDIIENITSDIDSLDKRLSKIETIFKTLLWLLPIFISLIAYIFNEKIKLIEQIASLCK
jgi:hypothetical protein